MHVCVVSGKQCWQDENGTWFSSGGFPGQMGAISTLFDQMSIIVVRVARRPGGIALPSQACIVPLREPSGVELRRKMSVLASSGYYLRNINRYVRQADAVHVPVPGDFPVLGLIIGLALRKRMLVRYCGSWYANSQTTLMSRFTRSLMRRGAGKRTVMLATGDAERPPAPGIEWIFSTALSSEELQTIPVRTTNRLSNPPRIAYVGRLSPEKGVQQLIEAVARLRAEYPEPMPRVTIIGDGPQRHYLARLSNTLHCNDIIQFKGQLNRTELSQCLSRQDFCVQPSLSEGLSKAWLDAMAHGLPVLSSNVGAAPAVIGRSGQRGWLVPAGDVASLAKQIQSVLMPDLDWTSLCQRCRSYVEGRTLEAWALEIGTKCSARWNIPLVDGKLAGVR